ncbi:MAG: hypothetical protein K2L02_05385 [Clostridia bacterium]|nr:hypothetical protein [Clostridia bacterium]
MNTNKTLQQLREEFSNAPSSQSEYMIEGKKYIVTRHFAGDKDIDQVIREIAVNRARRDFNL